MVYTRRELRAEALVKNHEDVSRFILSIRPARYHRAVPPPRREEDPIRDSASSHDRGAPDRGDARGRRRRASPQPLGRDRRPPAGRGGDGPPRPAGPRHGGRDRRVGRRRRAPRRLRRPFRRRVRPVPAGAGPAGPAPPRRPLRGPHVQWAATQRGPRLGARRALPRRRAGDARPPLPPQGDPPRVLPHGGLPRRREGLRRRPLGPAQPPVVPLRVGRQARAGDPDDLDPDRRPPRLPQSLLDDRRGGGQGRGLRQPRRRRRGLRGPRRGRPGARRQRAPGR